MKEKYTNVRCIIDFVEFKIETSSSLVLHKMMHSVYKDHTTVKTLVGIAPKGVFTFISNTYPGSISDKEIVVKSGFLNPNLWEQGDIVMADRGFLIKDYLKPLREVGLEIPWKDVNNLQLRKLLKVSNWKWKDTCGKNDTTFEMLSYIWQGSAN